MKQILQPIALSNNMDEVNQIISEPLIKALAIWPGFFVESKNELNRLIETFADKLSTKNEFIGIDATVSIKTGK